MLIKNIADLNACREQALERMHNKPYEVRICGGTGCTSSNSRELVALMKEEIAKHGIEDRVNVVQTGCFGLCALGPIVIVYPEGSFYCYCTPDHIR